MKVNSIQNTPIRAYNNKNGANKSNPSFKGDFLINCWDAIGRGGFASSFVVQDVCGSCIPRTAYALNRNKEITHKNNYLAAGETAIREVLTGPGMVSVPMLVLAASHKISGSANSVPMENIAPFSDEMKKILQSMPINPANGDCKPVEYASEAKKKFYQKAFSLMLGEKGDTVSKTAIELADDLMEYDSSATPKRNFIQQLLNKDIVRGKTKIRAKDQIYSSILTKYTDAKKASVDTFDTLLESDMNGILKKQNKVSSLVKDFSNFGRDVEKTLAMHSKDGMLPHGQVEHTSFMETFKQRRTGSKFITNILMVAATAIFLTQVPRLYTLSKTNPETDAFRNENGEVIRADK